MLLVIHGFAVDRVFLKHGVRGVDFKSLPRDWIGIICDVVHVRTEQATPLAAMARVDDSRIRKRGGKFAPGVEQRCRLILARQTAIGEAG